MLTPLGHVLVHPVPASNVRRYVLGKVVVGAKYEFVFRFFCFSFH